MSWRILVRHGPRVEKLRAEDLEAALDLVEREGRALAAGPGRRTVSMRQRQFTPQQQVAGRVELSGPGVRGAAGGRFGRAIAQEISRKVCPLYGGQLSNFESGA